MESINDDPLASTSDSSPQSKQKKKLNNAGPKERLRKMEEWKQEIEEWKDEVERGREAEITRLIQKEASRFAATTRTFSESSGVTFDVDKDLEDSNNNNNSKDLEVQGLRTEVEDLKRQLREQQDLLGSMKSSTSVSSDSLPTKETSGRLRRKGASLTNLAKARREHNLLPPDTYSFLVYTDYWTSSSSGVQSCPMPGQTALLSLLVLAIQVFAYSFFAADVMDVASSVEIRNPIGMPAGAEIVVRLSQILALFISTMSQDEIHFSLNALKIGYQRDLYRVVLGPNATFSKWLFSITLRFLVGFLSITVTFMLIVTSETVRDLMLDFTAVTFVSELDNVVFLLATLGYFGSSLQEDAERCVHTLKAVDTSASTFGHFRKRLPRWALLVVINIIMFGFWLWLTIRQVNGKYLEPAIYVQMADGYDTDLDYFSGWYTMNGDSLHDGRVMYKARTNLLTQNISDPGTFIYSRDTRSWLFSHSPFNLKQNNSNQENWYYAISEETMTFDISTISGVDNWYAHSIEKDRDLPMDIFSLQPYVYYVGKPCQADSECGLDLLCRKSECICPLGRLGASCELDPPCEIIEIDPSTSDGFEGARFWATTYKTVNDKYGVVIQAYGKPIYVGTNDQSDGVDVIIFTGVQWFLIHETDFLSITFSNLAGLDFQSREYALRVANALSEQFHAFWSRYNIAYVTEYVYFATSSDSASPVGLSWEIWGETRNLPSDQRMLCAVCNPDTNPCYFEGTCDRITKTCDCNDSGATGALCQLSPQGNGYCDDFFNNKRLQFDNGDCCMSSCVSTSTYTCGWEKDSQILGLSAERYIGYDDCTSNNICPSQKTNNCWTEIHQIAAASPRTICKSPISGNGGVWATAMCSGTDPSDVLSSVYTQMSSGWGQRGQTLAGQIVALSYDGVTAAVFLEIEGGEGRQAGGGEGEPGVRSAVTFFIWQAHRQFWVPHASLSTTSSLAYAVSLHSNTSPRIAVMSAEQLITVYELDIMSGDWIVLGRDAIAVPLIDTSSIVSLEFNGNTMTLLLTTSAFIFTFDTPRRSWSTYSETFRQGQLARHADISNNGGIVAFWLVNDDDADIESTCKEGNIVIYELIEQEWNAVRPTLPISALDYYDMNGQINNPVFALSGDGRYLLFLDCNTSSTVVYENKRRGWTRLDDLSVSIGLRETGSYYGISYSDDGKVFSSFQSNYDGRTTLYNNPNPSILEEAVETRSEAIENVGIGNITRVTLSIEIQLDDYPEDIGIFFRCNEEIFGKGSFGQFTVPSQYANTTISVERGSTCEFNIFDLTGDGMCCPNEGFYRIYFGEELIDRNLLVDGSGLFGRSATSTFVAARPL